MALNTIPQTFRSPQTPAETEMHALRQQQYLLGHLWIQDRRHILTARAGYSHVLVRADINRHVASTRSFTCQRHLSTCGGFLGLRCSLPRQISVTKKKLIHRHNIGLLICKRFGLFSVSIHCRRIQRRLPVFAGNSDICLQSSFMLPNQEAA